MFCPLRFSSNSTLVIEHDTPVPLYGYYTLRVTLWAKKRIELHTTIIITTTIILLFTAVRPILVVSVCLRSHPLGSSRLTDTLICCIIYTMRWRWGSKMNYSIIMPFSRTISLYISLSFSFSSFSLFVCFGLISGKSEATLHSLAFGRQVKKIVHLRTLVCVCGWFFPPASLDFSFALAKAHGKRSSITPCLFAPSWSLLQTFHSSFAGNLLRLAYLLDSLVTRIATWQEVTSSSESVTDGIRVPGNPPCKDKHVEYLLRCVCPCVFVYTDVICLQRVADEN